MNQQIERARKHLQENKTAYIVGGVCLVVGVIAGTRRSRKKISVTIPSLEPRLVSFEKLRDWIKSAHVDATDAIDKSGNYPLDMMYHLGQADALTYIQDLMALEGVTE